MGFAIEKQREEIFRNNQVGAWAEPEAAPDESLHAKCARLEIENARLRWYLQDIRRILERVPDHSLPRSVRFKRWGQQTLIEMVTRTAPRIAIIWGGAGAVAYIVHRLVT
jgi:hypothetical protein